MLSALEAFLADSPPASPENFDTQAVPAATAFDGAALRNDSGHARGLGGSPGGAAHSRLPSSGVLADVLFQFGLAPPPSAEPTTARPVDADPGTDEAREARPECRRGMAGGGPVADNAAFASSSDANADAGDLTSLINTHARAFVDSYRDDRSLKRPGKERAARLPGGPTPTKSERTAGAAGASPRPRARSGRSELAPAAGDSDGDVSRNRDGAGGQRGTRPSGGAAAGDTEGEDEIEEFGEEEIDGPESGHEGVGAEEDAYGIDSWPTLTCDPCDPEAGPLILGPRPAPVQPTAESNSGPAAESIYGQTAEVPASVNRHLRPYQRDGVRFLWRQYEAGKGGILGDEMGLGKTVQTIAFLSALLNKTAGPSDVRRRFPLASNDAKQAMIVVPVSTLGNWLRELRTWGCFRVATGHGAEREAALAAVRAREVELMLTTYETIRACGLQGDEISAHPWELTIWDEAHKIKNPKAGVSVAAAAVACPRRFCLTGTPMSNDHKELWALFHFVSNGRVGTEKEFRQFYSNVLKRGMRQSATQYELRQRVKRQASLKRLIDQWMLQRFKSIIAHQMPRKLDQIILCKLAQAQEKAYAAAIASPDYQALLRKDEKPCFLCGNRESPFKECCVLDLSGPIAQALHSTNEPCPYCPSCLGLPALSNLLKIANHLELIKPDPSSSLPPHKLAAQAAFAKMILGADAGVRDISFLERSSAQKCGKMRALEALLKTWKLRKAKVLLFSYSTQMLDILEDFVKSQNYSFLRLDGSTPPTKRTQLVDRFNADESTTFVFLLSTKAGGLGLNLVAATVVVIFDPNWNPSHDLQAQDRAYRIGQRHDVNVYRLVSSNTIEENMYLRQIYKRTQEHVALHQADPPRYFDGVLNNRREQGELFGISNLLRYHEKNDRSTTRELLSRAAGQKGAREAALPEEREEGFVILDDAARAAAAAAGDGATSDDGSDGRSSDGEEEENGGEADRAESTEFGGEEDFGGLAEILGDELHDIALHVHRDQDILGRLRSAVSPEPRKKRAKSGLRGDTAAPSPGAPSSSAPSPDAAAAAGGATRPSAGGGGAAAGLGAETPRAGRKSARRAEQDAARKAAHTCVGGFACYEDFVQALRLQAGVAEDVLRCVQQGHCKALEDAVNAMALKSVPGL